MSNSSCKILTSFSNSSARPLSLESCSIKSWSMWIMWFLRAIWNCSSAELKGYLRRDFCPTFGGKPLWSQVLFGRFMNRFRYHFWVAQFWRYASVFSSRSIIFFSLIGRSEIRPPDVIWGFLFLVWIVWHFIQILLKSWIFDVIEYFARGHYRLA